MAACGDAGRRSSGQSRSRPHCFGASRASGGLGDRAHAAGKAVEAGPEGTPPSDHHAPHQFRWKLAGNFDARVRSAVCRLPPGQAIASAGAATAICGFCGVAASRAQRQALPEAAGVLEEASGGCRRFAGASDGQAAACGRDFSRRDQEFHLHERFVAGPWSFVAPEPRQSVHDAFSGLRLPAVEI